MDTGKNVIAFADNNKARWSDSILGLKVISPLSISADNIIIVSIWSPENSYVQIKQQLEKVH